jgi:hypothetical protein
MDSFCIEGFLLFGNIVFLAKKIVTKVQVFLFRVTADAGPDNQIFR